MNGLGKIGLADYHALTWFSVKAKTWGWDLQHTVVSDLLRPPTSIAGIDKIPEQVFTPINCREFENRDTAHPF